MALALQHLLILCCYGGVPFLNYDESTPSRPSGTDGTPSPHFFRPLDPTDWIATDESGQLLNASVHPEILAADPSLVALLPSDADVELKQAGEVNNASYHGPQQHQQKQLPLDLEQCDLYNLTFSSPADEHLFHAAHGKLECRCPPNRRGKACHLSSTPLNSNTKEKRSGRSEGSGENGENLRYRYNLHPPSATTNQPPPPPSTNRATALVASAATTTNLPTSATTTENMTPSMLLTTISLGVASGSHMVTLVSSSTLAPSPGELGTTGGEGSAERLANPIGGQQHIRQHNHFAFYLFWMFVFMFAMLGIFMFLRGCCWVDCFGGLKLPFLSNSSRSSSRRNSSLHQPLNRDALNHCLEAVRAHEENEKKKNNNQLSHAPPNSISIDHSRRPLISSVSETCPHQQVMLISPSAPNRTTPYNFAPLSTLYDYSPHTHPPLRTTTTTNREGRPALQQEPGSGPSLPPSYVHVQQQQQQSPQHQSVAERERRRQPSPPPSYKSLDLSSE